MKIQIKSRLNGSILFECEATSIKLALEIAIKSGADLSGANLFKADLSRTNLYGEKINKIPIQISGLKWWVNITKIHIQIGCQIHKAEEWFNFTDEQITAMHEEALIFWKTNKDLIKLAWETHCQEDK